jgi:hypothetical protein
VPQAVSHREFSADGGHASRWKPAQATREEEEDEHPAPEGGDAHPDDGERLNERLPSPARDDGRRRPESDPGREREAKRRARQQERRGEPLPDDVEDGPALTEGLTPVADQGSTEPHAVLDQQRPIEPPEGADACDRIGRGRRIGAEDVGGSTGRDLEDEEEQERDQEEAGPRLEGPPPGMAQQPVTSLVVRPQSLDQSAAFHRLPAGLGA